MREPHTQKFGTAYPYAWTAYPRALEVQRRLPQNHSKHLSVKWLVLILGEQASAGRDGRGSVDDEDDDDDDVGEDDDGDDDDDDDK